MQCLNMALQHYEDTLKFYGEFLGGRVIRKHLGWYMDGAKTRGPLRKTILTATDPKTVLARLSEALAPDRESAAA